MSDETDRGAQPSGGNPDPMPHITTYTYDGGGTLISRSDEGKIVSFSYTSPGLMIPAEQPAGLLAHQPLNPPLRVVAHTFEFRSGGSEGQEQSIAVERPEGAEMVAGVASVQVSYGVAAGAGDRRGLLSGLDVHAELCDGRLVCRVRLTEFAADDLVVVRVEAFAAFAAAG